MRKSSLTTSGGKPIGGPGKNSESRMHARPVMSAGGRGPRLNAIHVSKHAKQKGQTK